jgi:hypothetical protein
MKIFLQTMPLVLAALLQLMPLLRNIIAHPAAGSTMAFILRWGVGAGATIGAYDTVSGATTVFFTTPTNFSGTVGVYFTNNVAITNNGVDSGAFFALTNKLNAVSPALYNGQSTTVALPPGLTFKCIDLNNGSAPAKRIYGAIYGTPTTATTNYFVHILAGYTNQIPAQTNIFITILPASGTPPSISVQPVGVTTVAGSSPVFSVTASGTATLAYQWRLAAGNISGANASTLTLPNVRASQAGNYTVVITNSSGVITSSVAILTVTNPLPRTLTSPVKSGGNFQFTFVPTVGLTNTVQANGTVNGGAWNTFSNVPPPASATPVTITDVMGNTNKFYRVLVQP